MGRASSQCSKPSSKAQKKTYKLSTQERRAKKQAKEEKLDTVFANVKVFHDKEDAVAALVTKPKGQKLSLKDFHRDYAGEYEEVDDETKQIAINALKEQRKSKRIPIRKKGRAALRDVNGTMAKIATMADQLALCTDHQVLILASKTSHPSYAAPMAHVMSSAEGFTDTLFKTDLYAMAHHFEAYGTEGSQGLAHSSWLVHSRLKGEVVGALKKNLKTVSDRCDASVSYKHFHHKVVLRYHINFVGWPSNIPFKNPSELKRAHLKEIHALATSTPPQLHFIALNQEELSKCIEKRAADEANGLQSDPRPCIHLTMHNPSEGIALRATDLHFAAKYLSIYTLPRSRHGKLFHKTYATSGVRL